jgi:hypothetical protein
VCAPRQTLLRLLYDDEGVFYRRYHAVVSKDDAAKVTPWATGGGGGGGANGAGSAASAAAPGEAPAVATRSVTFTKRMDIPAAVTRLLGALPPALARFLSHIPRFLSLMRACANPHAPPVR